MEVGNKKGHVKENNLDKTDPDLLNWCNALNITLEQYYTMPDDDMMVRIYNLKNRIRLETLNSLIAYQNERSHLREQTKTTHCIIEKKEQTTTIPKLCRESAGAEKYVEKGRNSKPQTTEYLSKTYKNEVPGTTEYPSKTYKNEVQGTSKKQNKKILYLQKNSEIHSQKEETLLPNLFQKSLNKAKHQVQSNECVHSLLPKFLRKNRKNNGNNINKSICEAATDVERLYGGGNENCGNILVQAMDSRNFDDYDECSEDESYDEDSSWIEGWRRPFIELVDPPVLHNTSFDNDSIPLPVARDFNPASQLCSTPKLGQRGRRPFLRNFSDYEFHLSGLGNYLSPDNAEQNISIAENGFGAKVVHITSKSRIVAPHIQKTEYSVGRPHATFNAGIMPCPGRGNAACNTGNNNNANRDVISTAKRQNATFNAGRQNATYNAGRQNATYNAERQNATHNAERQNAIFNAGKQNATFNAERQNARYDAERRNAIFNAGRQNATYNGGKQNTTFDAGKENTAFKKTINNGRRTAASNTARRKRRFNAGRGNACVARQRNASFSPNQTCKNEVSAKATYILKANRSESSVNISECLSTSIGLPLANSTMRNNGSQKNSCSTSPERLVNAAPENEIKSTPRADIDQRFDVNSRCPSKNDNECAIFTANRNVKHIIIKLI